jgi:RNA polymerase sigma factor (TIGR02999 family)
MSDVTRILNAIEGGDAKATDELLPLVYEELRMLAAQKLSHEKPGQTLQATALVHEAYIRLLGDEPLNWDNRGHFFSAAAEAMRRILVDNARRKKSLKHGGGQKRTNVEECQLVAPISASPEDLVALDESLSKLEETDVMKAKLVKLCFFAGLTGTQAAELLDISPSKAYEELAYARAWLQLEME